MIIETEIVNGVEVEKITYEETDFCTESEKEAVSEICQSCDKYNEDLCSECDCLLHVLTALKESHCPINKW